MKMKNQIIVFFIILLYFLILGVIPVFGEICEKHDFGSPNIQTYVYSDGRTWDFDAQNDIVVGFIETYSVLGSNGGTFHIEVKVNDDVKASWDQYVGSTLYQPYINTSNVSFSLSVGDTITYRIYGGSFSTPVGGITGVNYVKLCQPTDLTVTPAEGFNSSGDEGGPFTPSSINYTLENTGSSPISWQASKGENWVSLSIPNSGTLGVGESTTVTVSINSDANSLTPDNYLDTVTFINTTNGSGNTTRSVNLSIFTTCEFPFEEDFETDGIDPCWRAYSTEEGRILVTGDDGPYEGNFHLTMDDSLGNSTYSLNELILAIDLSGQKDVMLSFFHKEFGDEDHEMPDSFSGSHNSDGVAVSADGVTWYKIQGFTGADGISSDYKQFRVDLDAAIASSGLSYNDSFLIKFQQYDNYAISSDGFAFDNIRLYLRKDVGLPWIPLLLLDD